MRNALFSLPLVAVVAACSSAPEPGADVSAKRTPVEVTATYRERILLPPGHVLSIRVEDVSLADAPARVLAEVRQPLEGRAPPFAVTIEVPADEVDPRHTYAVRAEIRDPEGALRFTTDIRHVVMTQGARNKADIVMVGVR
jgi:putative lipoprotein